jgi:HEAT repeat protein
LIQALEDETIRGSVISAILAIGPDANSAAPSLVKLLHDDPDRACSASTALGHLGPKVLPNLKLALQHQDADVRRWAAHAVQVMGPEAREAIDWLIEALDDSSAEVRSNTAEALASIGKESSHALTLSLKSDKPWRRMHAARALRRIDPSNASATDALIASMLSDDKELARYALAHGFGKVGPELGKVIPPLRGLLSNSDSETRYRAAMLLGDIGPIARSATPELLGALSDTNAEVRAFACRALAQVEPQAHLVLQPLMRRLVDNDEDVRAWAAEALGRQGPDAKVAITVLTKAQEDPSESVREAAAKALKRIRR